MKKILMTVAFAALAIAGANAQVKFGVRAGLTYSNQGYKTKIGDGKVIDHTLNLPVWFKYDFAGFRPKAGLYAGYIVERKAEWGGRTVIRDRDAYNYFDYGISLGAEYNLPNNGLFFEASYNWGLANLDKNGDAKNYTNNRVIQVGIGYKF